MKTIVHFRDNQIGLYMALNLTISRQHCMNCSRVNSINFFIIVIPLVCKVMGVTLMEITLLDQNSLAIRRKKMTKEK